MFPRRRPILDSSASGTCLREPREDVQAPYLPPEGVAVGPFEHFYRCDPKPILRIWVLSTEHAYQCTKTHIE